MVGQFAKVVAFVVDEVSGKPLESPGYLARLFDADPMQDDPLGEGPIASGQVEILFDLDNSTGWDKPLEPKPDL